MQRPYLPSAMPSPRSRAEGESRMIVLSPPVGLPRTNEERDQFLEKTKAFGSTTVSSSTRPDWTDDDVEAARRVPRRQRHPRRGVQRLPLRFRPRGRRPAGCRAGALHPPAQARQCAGCPLCRLLDVRRTGQSRHVDGGYMGALPGLGRPACGPGRARRHGRGRASRTLWRRSARSSGTAKCSTAPDRPGSRC